jgi:hypothetical protein
VGGSTDVDTTITWELPSDAMSREAHGMQMVMAGLLGPQDFVEEYRKAPDPEKALKRIQQGAPFTHQLVKDFLAQRWLRSAQEAEQAKIQKAQANRARSEAQEPGLYGGGPGISMMGQEGPEEMAAEMAGPMMGQEGPMDNAGPRV